MPCACVDIGTNTTRLLVAEATGDAAQGPARPRELLAQRAFLPLGSGPLDPGRVDELAAVVAAQVRVAREAGAAHVRVVATAALRGAPDRDALVAALERAAGVRVEVLSGEEEARLAFAGATCALEHAPAEPVGVVDVGGGSTELVVGSLARGVAWSASLCCGSGLLADAWLRSDPPAPHELHAARTQAAGTFEGLAVPPPVCAYAVGGGAGSLARLVGPELNGASIARAIDVLAGAPAAVVAERFSLHADRVRLLPAALVLLEAAAHAFAAPLRIATGGMREGIVLEELARPRPHAAPDAGAAA